MQEAYNTSAELKNVVNELIDQLSKLIKITIPASFVRNEIKKFYDKGLAQAEVKLNMNFVRDEGKLDFLETYTFDNVKGLNEDLVNKLRQELSRGLLNLESTNQLTKRVQKVLDVGTTRAKMIARTEANRALNQAHLDAAEQSSLKLKKWLSVSVDGRTSNICMAEHSKYGDESKAIPLNKDFVVNVGGNEYRGMSPPFHPNCRTRLMTVQVD